MMLISFFPKIDYRFEKTDFFDYRIWASPAVAISLCSLLGLCNVPRSMR